MLLWYKENLYRHFAIVHAHAMTVGAWGDGLPGQILLLDITDSVLCVQTSWGERGEEGEEGRE